MDDLWQIYSDYIFTLRSFFDFRIHSFVLMPNHFHMLATPTAENRAEALNYFMRETSRVIRRHTRRINHLYGGRYHATLVNNEVHRHVVYRYVYRNPVKAGLSKKCETYKYSTLPGLLGLSHLPVALTEDTILFGHSTERVLRWLNTDFKNENSERIRRALRTPEFRLAVDKASGLAPELTSESLDTRFF
jgi:putative transposase